MTYRRFLAKDFLKRYRTYETLSFKRKSEKATDYSTAQSIVRTSQNELQGYEKDLRFDSDVFVDGEHIFISIKAFPKKLTRYKTVKIPATLSYAVEGFLRVHPNIKIKREGDYYLAKVERRVHNPEQEIIQQITQKMSDRGYSR